MFRATEAEEIINRISLIKGLTAIKVVKRLKQLLDKQAVQKCIDIVSRTVWNTFYDQVWRIQCGKVQEWEKKTNITGRMKKGARANVKRREKKDKGKLVKEVEKEKKAEKTSQMKKEAWKTIDVLVMEGERPFWYGFK